MGFPGDSKINDALDHSLTNPCQRRRSFEMPPVYFIHVEDHDEMRIGIRYLLSGLLIQHSRGRLCSTF